MQARSCYYVAQAVTKGNLSGDGFYTQACCRLLEDTFDIQKVLLTPSCTAALEMAAILCGFSEGDEVIMPSYTFVSTASAFLREGAKPVFIDIRPDTLNIDEKLIEKAITPKTKAICAVHYAGVACEMDTILSIAKKHQLLVIEDAAQAVNSFYKGRALGSIGDLGCYSFHETKNFISGEGGALCINNPRLRDRAEIIRDKGTNRQKFIRGQVDKYTWVDEGSSYVPSELCSAFLFGQLELMEAITHRRRQIHEKYAQLITSAISKERPLLPTIPKDCKSNYHMFYMLAASNQQRNSLIQHCREKSIGAVFHYVPLHSSPMGQRIRTQVALPITDHSSARLVRLPMFHDITDDEQSQVSQAIAEFYGEQDASSN